MEMDEVKVMQNLIIIKAKSSNQNLFADPH
jgi:hypothetical protein